MRVEAHKLTKMMETTITMTTMMRMMAVIPAMTIVDSFPLNSI